MKTLKLYLTCEYGTKESSTNFVGMDFEVNLEEDELAFIHKIISVDRDLRDNASLLRHHAPQLYRKLMDAGVMEFERRYKDCRCIQRNIRWTSELLDATRSEANQMVSDDDCELLFIKACALVSRDYSTDNPVIDETTIFSIDYLKVLPAEQYDFAKMADIPLYDWAKIVKEENERIYIDLLKNDEEHHNEIIVNSSGCDEHLLIFYIDWQQLQLKQYQVSLTKDNARFGVCMMEIVHAIERSLRIINKKGQVWSMFLDDLSFLEEREHYRLSPISSKTKYEATLYEDHDINSRILSVEVRDFRVCVNEGDSGPACGMMNGKRSYDRDLYGINLYELAGLLGARTLREFFSEMKRRFGFYDGMDRFHDFLKTHNVKFAAYAG